MDTVMETTRTVEAARQMLLRNGELAHRIKNSLNVVSAIVNQTLRNQDEFKSTDQLCQRIGALADAQSVLIVALSQLAMIGEVIAEALKPFRSGQSQFHIDGPQVRISAKQALILALAINELATNTLKYGALSGPNGRIDLQWHAGASDSDEPFHLIWAERGGSNAAQHP